MASLGAYKRNMRAITDGEWIKVGPDGLEFEIKTRGFTAAYKDALAILRRKAANSLNRQHGFKPGDRSFTPDELLPSVDDRIQAEALTAHCLLGVRGLTHPPDEEGVEKPVTIDEFREMLFQEEYGEMLNWVLQAALAVQTSKEKEIDDAGKNSSSASSGS